MVWPLQQQLIPHHSLTTTSPEQVRVLFCHCVLKTFSYLGNAYSSFKTDMTLVLLEILLVLSCWLVPRCSQYWVDKASCLFRTAFSIN